MKNLATLPILLQSFFTERLYTEQKVSPHTVASYRDTFRLLICFASEKVKKSPDTLLLSDLNADLIRAFLHDLETRRRICARSRNQRLAAIRAFYSYTSFQVPEQTNLISQVLAIKGKRHDKRLVDFLEIEEVQALLSIPDRTTWIGFRDYTLLLLAVQTGLRVSELTSLCKKDIVLGRGAHVHCIGKGRKERCTPLIKQTATVLKSWIKAQKNHNADSPLFPTILGGHMSSDAVQHLLGKYAHAARKKCASLKQKRVSPHVLRHTAAMQLFLSGVDISLIALWLGHSRSETAQIYIDANLNIKEKLLEKVSMVEARRGRYRPTGRLMTFLKGL